MRFSMHAKQFGVITLVSFFPELFHQFNGHACINRCTKGLPAETFGH